MARSFRPLRFAVVVVVVAVVSLSLTGCVADPPPRIGVAVGGDQVARVSWQPPLAVFEGLVAYVVTPWVGQAAQPSIWFNTTATTRTLTGLTNGTTYTFTVAAINDRGYETASSGASNPVTPAVGPLSGVAVSGDSAAQSNSGDCSGDWHQFFDDSYPGSGTVGTVTFHLEGCTSVNGGYDFTGGTFTISTSIGSVSGTAAGTLGFPCFPSPICPLKYDLTLTVISGTDAFADTAGTLHAHIEWDASTDSSFADLSLTVP